jgi:hypothetical protein
VGDAELGEGVGGFGGEAVGEYNRVVEVNVDRAQVAVLAESSN